MLTNQAEEVAHLVNEQLGLLERGEVAASVHFVPVPQVREQAFRPRTSAVGRSDSCPLTTDKTEHAYSFVRESDDANSPVR
jgi:hypothetical protein